jgi:hypothetical protein
MNGIGLCGAHRSGKTTLARAYAERVGIEARHTDTSAVFRQAGFDPAQKLDFNTRLNLQEAVLSAAEKVWAAPGAFITDRTPLDFMAYTLADIQGGTCVDEARLQTYFSHCFAALARFFSSVIVVQPGIALIHESGKAALNSAYMEHLNTLVLGLGYDPRQSCAVHVLPRSLLDLEARVAWLRQAVDKSF